MIREKYMPINRERITNLSLFYFGGLCMKENAFQQNLIKEIKERFPGSIVMKNDSSYIQGIPDLTILYGSKWAALEVKKDNKASHQPNQDYYVNRMDNMSYAKFICPENKKEILDELERALEPKGQTCFFGGK